MDARLNAPAVPVHQVTDLSFSRKNRLLTQAEYNSVFREGARKKYGSFIGQVKPNSLGRPRLGLAITKKACRAASDRNRIKRLIREYFRENKSSLEGRDFIVLVTPAAASTTRSNLRADLEKIFLKMCNRNLSSTGRKN